MCSSEFALHPQRDIGEANTETGNFCVIKCGLWTSKCTKHKIKVTTSQDASQIVSAHVCVVGACVSLPIKWLQWRNAYELNTPNNSHSETTHNNYIVIKFFLVWNDTFVIFSFEWYQTSPAFWYICVHPFGVGAGVNSIVFWHQLCCFAR